MDSPGTPDGGAPEDDGAASGDVAAGIAPDQVASLIEVFGGVRGMVESTVPGVGFVLLFTITRQVGLSGAVAVALAAALAVPRLLRRQTVRHALGGLLGVAICAFVAWKSGNAADFYLPRILLNVLYAAGCLLSIVVRWPFMGVMLGPLFGENFTWRKRPARRAAYMRMTWIWFALFVFRLLAEIPLYLFAGPTVLGIAVVALGVPPWLVAIYLCWLVLVRAPAPVRDPNGLWGAERSS